MGNKNFMKVAKYNTAVNDAEKLHQELYEIISWTPLNGPEDDLDESLDEARRAAWLKVQGLRGSR